MGKKTAVKKIVVIGPESTGKSTLCGQLAAHFHTQWCPEYAREYLLKKRTNYTYDDLLIIAKGQVGLEEHYLSMVNLSAVADGQWSIKQARDSRLLFIDTDLYVMKVWCEFVFDKCHKWILEQVAERRYDLYLLCHTDLPWVKDELREYPDPATREKLFKIYRDLMINQHTPWVEIKGNEEVRLRTAVDAVNAIL